MKLRNMNDILQSKLVKRGISIKALDYQKIEPAAQQHDHLPLLAVHMRPHVAVRLERNQQALNLVLMVRV